MVSRLLRRAPSAGSVWVKMPGASAAPPAPELADESAAPVAAVVAAAPVPLERPQGGAPAAGAAGGGGGGAGGAGAVGLRLRLGLRALWRWRLRLGLRLRARRCGDLRGRLRLDAHRGGSRQASDRGGYTLFGRLTIRLEIERLLALLPRVRVMAVFEQ